MPGVNRQLGRSRMSVTNGGVSTWNSHKYPCGLRENSADKAGALLGMFSVRAKHGERNAMVVLDFTGTYTYTLQTTVGIWFPRHHAGNGGNLHEKGNTVRLHLGA